MLIFVPGLRMMLPVQVAVWLASDTSAPAGCTALPVRLMVLAPDRVDEEVVRPEQSVALAGQGELFADEIRAAADHEGRAGGDGRPAGDRPQRQGGPERSRCRPRYWSGRYRCSSWSVPSEPPPILVRSLVPETTPVKFSVPPSTPITVGALAVCKAMVPDQVMAAGRLN